MVAVWLAGLRDRAEVEQAFRAAAEAAPHLAEHPYIQGLVAGYGWVLGTRGASPAWERSGPPADSRAVTAEATAAEAAAWRQRSISRSNMSVPRGEVATDPPPDLDRDYAMGVARSLKWAAGGSIGPAPWPRPAELLRSPAELERAAAAVADRAAVAPSDFYRGAAAGFAWVLGKAAAPISGRTDRPGHRDLVAEEQLADDAIYRRRDAAEVPRDWAVGVQHALMWAHHTSDSAPVDI